MAEGDLSGIVSAAEALATADAVVVAAGAGIGVDSGMPDFRGREGFWQAYPAFAKLGLEFAELANPQWFHKDPALAWGFYGHRYNLYRAKVPHGGFAILKRWSERTPNGGFVFTSNVDGHFQKAGFDSDRIVEVHGACSVLQCTASCGIGIFPVAKAIHSEVAVDEATMRAREPLPVCPACGALARPNILMFSDWEWLDERTANQRRRLRTWIEDIAGLRIVVVECGAGSTIPTVRHFSEQLVVQFAAKLIRINVRESEVPCGQIGLPLGAREALELIDAKMAERESAGGHSNS